MKKWGGRLGCNRHDGYGKLALLKSSSEVLVTLSEPLKERLRVFGVLL